MSNFGNKISIKSASLLALALLLFFSCGKGLHWVTDTPTITIINNSNTYLSPPGSGGTQMTIVDWTVNRQGVYSFAFDRDCSTTSDATGVFNTSGDVDHQESMSSGIRSLDFQNPITGINYFPKLLPGEERKVIISICVKDDVNGKMGKADFEVILRNDLPIVTQSNVPPYTEANPSIVLKDTDTFDIDWSTDTDGDFTVNINEICDNSSNSTGANASGAVTENTPMTSTIQGSDLQIINSQDTVNYVRICVYHFQSKVPGHIEIPIVRAPNPMPVIANPRGSTNGSAIQVQLKWCKPGTGWTNCDPYNGTIIYRLDGAPGFVDATSMTPDASSLVYTPGSNITISTNTTLRALGRRIIGSAALDSPLQTETYTINNTFPSLSSDGANPVTLSRAYIGEFGNTTANINWQYAEGTGPAVTHYKVADSANCGGGSVVPVSDATVNGPGVSFSTPIPATHWATGSLGITPETIRLCLSTNGGTAWNSYVDFYLYVDNLRPTTTVSLPGGFYNKVQKVYLTCGANDNCKSTAYTDAPLGSPISIPNFDGNGNVTNGYAFTSQGWTSPLNEIRVFRYRSIDFAGNVEIPDWAGGNGINVGEAGENVDGTDDDENTEVYTVDNSVRITFHTDAQDITEYDDNGTPNDANDDKFVLSWDTNDRAGLQYLVKLNGSNCDAPTIIQSGFTVQGMKSENISVGSLLTSGAWNPGTNYIRFCVINLDNSWSEGVYRVDPRYDLASLPNNGALPSDPDGTTLKLCNETPNSSTICPN